MIHSLFGISKINRINQHEWLKDILSSIKNHPINRIVELLPHNWKSQQEWAVSRTDTLKQFI